MAAFPISASIGSIAAAARAALHLKPRSPFIDNSVNSPVAVWETIGGAPPQIDPADWLERGRVLLLPRSPFALNAEEKRLLDPAVSDGKAKNIRFDPDSAMLGGSALQGTRREALAAMMARFSQQARALVLGLFPSYEQRLQTRLVSFRPIGVEGRPASARKDDSRLHVDAFASRPNQGQRILRVFTNLNPHGQPRVWNVGEPFEAFARRFLPRIPSYSPLLAGWLERLRITKSRRTEYDHIMLHLHDLGKLDLDYQRSAPAERVEFQPGSAWICYSDQVLHAALAGHYMMEQTFFLPVAGMVHPEHSPLRVLERLAGRPLL
jgi:hypothetical protein